jgi:protein-ribulosamine 3-kinase
MIYGEFKSMTALHDTLPDNTPRPLAWGTYAIDSDIHFFLSEFVEMTSNPPDVDELAKSLAGLHQKISPNGKYGFHVPTLQGTLPQYTEWTDTWEDFFTKSLKQVMDYEIESQGHDDEVERLYNEVLKKVVTGLLRPLDTKGRSIQPCLVHGDIWDGNVSTAKNTNTPIIYDATCIYAHNESTSR